MCLPLLPFPNGLPPIQRRGVTDKMSLLARGVPGPWVATLNPIVRTEIHQRSWTRSWEPWLDRTWVFSLVERETCFMCEKDARRCLVARGPMTHLANGIWAQVRRSLAGWAHNTFFMVLHTLLLPLLAGWMSKEGPEGHMLTIKKAKILLPKWPSCLLPLFPSPNLTLVRNALPLC